MDYHPWYQPTPVSLAFNGNNRITTPGYQYDAAGNLLMDNLNCYSYDAENRLSSVAPETAPRSDVCGATTMNYLYDPEGRRVAKVQNGTTVKASYYDAAGDMIAETDGNGTLLRAEIFAGGRHLATWSNNATFFNHADWLGTERARTDVNGNRCETITSLPFGDGQITTGGCGDPSPNHFTGKERDTESGLDDTPYRKYASNSGRWLSPDPVNLTWKRLINPSNTLNKYAYAANNPLLYKDESGRDITVFYRAPDGIWDSGHVLLAVTNQATGQVRFADYFPVTGWNKRGLSERGVFNRPNEDRLKQHAALTIRTTPEVAQKLIDRIDPLSNNPPDFNMLTSNCTTTCSDLLKLAGIDVGNTTTPEDLWSLLYADYSAESQSEPSLLWGIMYRYQPGTDFGVSMSAFPAGTDPFYNLQLLYLIANQQSSQTSQQQQSLPRGCVTVADSASGTSETSCE